MTSYYLEDFEIKNPKVFIGTLFMGTLYFIYLSYSITSNSSTS